MSGLLVLLAVGTATAQVDLQRVELVKGVDRNDGVIPPLGQGELPYFFEICASGSGFDTVRVERLSNLALLGYFQPPECIEDRLADLIALDEAVPSDDYGFTFLQQGVPVDSISVLWDAEESLAFADVLSPAHGAADVNPSIDLDVRWTIDPMDCLPSGAVDDCADGIQLFVVDPLLDVDVSENFGIPIDATSWPIDASVLQENTEYDLELETFKGIFDEEATTDGGDPALVTAIFRDTNNTSFITTVPEPGAAVVGFFGLAAAGLLARLRRGPAQ
jgi:hypothetical protein